MSEWKIYRLGDICKNVCSGGTPKSTEPLYYGGEIPWLNTKEVDFCRIAKTEKTITDSGFQNSSTKWIDKNSVIVAMYGATAAKVAVNTIPLTTNQACCNLMIDPNLADFRFVYFYLCYKYTSLAALANGGAQQNLNTQRIKDFEITLPLLKEQKCIADILWALDDKIELNRRINANLEEQAQALFKSWFVDSDPFRDSPFVDSELGKIPKGWKVNSIEDLASYIASGGTPRSLDSSYYDGDIRWFTTKELKDEFLFDSEKHISQTALKNSAAKLFPENTVLMAIYASPTVGRLGILTAESTCNQAAVGIIAKEELGYAYLYLLLLSERINLNNLASGAAQQNLNVGIVKRYRVLVPTIDILGTFNEIINPIFATIRNNTAQIYNLSALRDTLLPKLMSSELSVESNYEL